MSYNFVNVAIQVTGPEGATSLSGGMTFYVSDFVWDTSTKEIVVVQPVPLHASGGFTGNQLTVPLLAMDNPSLSTTWAWLVTAGIPGQPGIVPVHKLTVDFANGADQNLADLMAASTII